MVHDEIVLVCEESIVNEVRDNLEKAMIKAGNMLCRKVPTEVGSFIADYWKH